MDKFFDSIGAVAQASAPYAAVATFGTMAVLVGLGVGLAFLLPRVGRLLRIPRYQHNPNYFGVAAE
jgi:hypothetical protein